MNKNNRLFYVLLGIYVFIIVIGIVVVMVNGTSTNINAGHLDQVTKPIPKQVLDGAITLQAGEFNITLPENFTQDIVEVFTDIFWDYDGDSGGGGILTVIWSFVPGFGSNSAVTVQAAVILSIFGGFVILAKYMGIGIPMFKW